MRLYIAGPLFSPYHRANIASNVKRLRELGHECFVPQEKEHNSDVSTSLPAQVFGVDLAGLRWADAMILHLDDPDVSSGVACEIGIFYELIKQNPKKIGVLGLLQDERSWWRDKNQVGECLNFFTMGCIEKVGAIYDNLDKLLEHLTRWQKEFENSGLS